MSILNSLFHIHEYDYLDAKGHQRCKHCGKAIYIGIPFVEPTFTIHERVEFINKQGEVCKITYIQKCIETGELKSFTIKN
jgi:hypothetical protein